MDTQTRQRLMDELRALHGDKQFWLDETVTPCATDLYRAPAHFAREREQLFRGLPQIAAHHSELPEAGSFLRRSVGGRNLLLTRDNDGQVHALINQCRHRGAELVREISGCKRRFSCPYHAWTWDNRGELVAIPHREAGFPGLANDALALNRLHCEEHRGWIITSPKPFDAAQWLGEIGADFDWLGTAALRVVAEDTLDIAANWKLLVEGGIEAYHFKVAHRATIAPYFLDNLSSYQCFGDHMRSVLPRATLVDGPDDATPDIREHANLLYTVFPLNQMLVQQDHLVWIQMEPLAADRSVLRMKTMAAPDSGSPEHWAKNHRITRVTLDEDFAIGESIQRAMDGGANEQFFHGRYEGALQQFRQRIDSHLAGAG